MKKINFNIYNLLALIIVVTLVGWLSTYYILQFSLNEIYEQQLLSSKREAREIAKLIESRIDDDIKKETIISDLQKTIQNTDYHISFICLFNSKGVQLCHPDPAMIGQKINSENSYIIKITNNDTVGSFLSLLNAQKEGGGLRKFSNKNEYSEIIYVYPVKNTDWMIAAHTNIDVFNNRMNQLKTAVILLNIAAGFTIVFFAFISIRLINGGYEKFMERKNEKLQKSILELSELNSSLLIQQKNFKNQDIELNNDKEIYSGNDFITDSRILVSWRDQLIPIKIDKIAYFYTDVTGTKIICSNNDKYRVNYSLEDIYKRLNKHVFFRANRQFIISINSIKAIYKFGNNQLKIEVEPRFDKIIIISKNRASEFKKWLNS